MPNARFIHSEACYVSDWIDFLRTTGLRDLRAMVVKANSVEASHGLQEQKSRKDFVLSS